MRSGEDILKSLNPSQQAAVVYDGRALLILAGAGSGKTRVLTSRIAHFIANGVPSFNVLGVTFTNKAAAEMGRRVHALVGQQVWISTFHSTCLKILRMEADGEFIPKEFTIYDDHDQLVLIKDCFKDLKLNDKQINPKSVREAISRAKDQLMTPKDFKQTAQDYYQDIMAKIYDLYQKKMEEFKGLDFGDLIFKTVQMFEKDPVRLAAYQERFRYILVDEYQDTNHAQYRLVTMLAGREGNITVVGDPDQSIYAWRGADIRNIMEFEEDFSDAKLIKLEQNYRSTNNILRAANHVITRNMNRKPKDLWSEREDGEPIFLYEAYDEKEESQWVVRQIRDYQRKNYKLRDMVVFYRVHAQSRIIEDVLRREKVPYVIVGGVRFYDRKEIKDLMAYFKVIVSPDDEVSLKRIINEPARGIGKKTLEDLAIFRRERNISFYNALGRAKEMPDTGSKIKNRLEDFHKMMEHFRAVRQSMGLEELAKNILDRTGYWVELEREGTLEAKSRMENIREFLGVIQEFEENASVTEKERLLESFLETMSLETNMDSWNESDDTLTLMTLHTAKGLEFPIVFMVGMEEEVFPHVNSYGADRTGLEEERRLCYVGITRAMERLHLSFANMRRLYGYTTQNLPSRFLNEIPQNLVEFVARPSEKSFDRQSDYRPSKTRVEDDEYVEFDEEELRKS
ncbi:MAG: UvrD-helicase domain-containing protein [Candidatus Omnitrophica bacterium]|nr:UvrD-helicase domain-containing protein [Candidatus Omnitrophota bacterium]